MDVETGKENCEKTNMAIAAPISMERPVKRDVRDQNDMKDQTGHGCYGGVDKEMNGIEKRRYTSTRRMVCDFVAHNCCLVSLIP